MIDVIGIEVGHVVPVNCYIVFDTQTREAMVVDPGDEGPRLMTEIDKLGLKIKYIVNTHSHFDHIGANKYLKEKTGAPLMIHKNEGEFLENAHELAVMFGVELSASPAADTLLHGHETLTLGENRFFVVSTPGHSFGSVTLVGDKMAFVGDLIFRESVGRTDLPTGDPDQLATSIRKTIYTLDNETVLYSGHGPETTVGHEKKYNPFVRL